MKRSIAQTYTVQPTEPAGALLYSAPIISLRIVRDGSARVPEQIKSPADIAGLLQERYADADREIMAVVLLDIKNRVLGIDPVVVGSLDSAVVTMREVFKSAVMVGAAAIVVAHNHPSGSADPSPEDVRITREIIAAGKLLEIEVLDHIILAAGRYTSLRERGAFGTK
ncbi:MAG TPA: JAB domain-containing protein [Roseiflexaceae bacterium]|jgi:DNA repair protein RadC